MQALEVGHLRRITGFNQRFIAGPDQLDETAAQHDLFAEQVRLALFLEGRLDHPGASPTDRAGIGKRGIMRVARSILVDRDQARHAAATLVFGAHRMTRTFRCNHHNVDRLAWLDQREMHIKAVRERDRGAVLDIGLDAIFPNIGLQFIRRTHHDQVSRLGRFSNRFDRQAICFGLFRRC